MATLRLLAVATLILFNRCVEAVAECDSGSEVCVQDFEAGPAHAAATDPPEGAKNGRAALQKNMKTDERLVHVVGNEIDSNPRSTNSPPNTEFPTTRKEETIDEILARNRQAFESDDPQVLEEIEAEEGDDRTLVVHRDASHEVEEKIHLRMPNSSANLLEKTSTLTKANSTWGLPYCPIFEVKGDCDYHGCGGNHNGYAWCWTQLWVTWCYCYIEEFIDIAWEPATCRSQYLPWPDGRNTVSTTITKYKCY